MIFVQLRVGVSASSKPVAISTSWGGSEYSGETNDDATHFNDSGVAITAGSGDSGYDVECPAASPYAAPVGGTTLFKTRSGYWDWLSSPGPGKP